MTVKEKRKELLDEMCELGKCYLDEENVEEALRWLNSAAALGSNKANTELGEMYYYGFKVQENFPKAAEYFSRGYADDEIILNAQFGDMYRYGQGVEKNIEKAILWYEVEAAHGSREAKLELAEIYFYGEGDIKPDEEKAVNYLAELALDGGDYCATAEDLYAEGQNIPLPCGRSGWILYGDDEARFKLGCMYLYGEGVKKNVFKAACWFANMNSYINDIEEFFDVLFDLAEKYRTGNDVEKNIDKAIAWYEQIINYCDFHNEALFALAEIYFYGEDGIERNFDKAVDLYRRSADCGNLKAAHRLADIYLNGKGIDINFTEARYYLDKLGKRLSDKIKE